MGWVLHQTAPVRHQLGFSPPPPPSQQPIQQNNLSSKISPSILLIIVIVAVIFFISGLLHLLVRYLLRPTDRDADDAGDATALQGQLQQLFQLHDAGVDQSFIDTLPVFLYKAIIGLKDPFDCAVCLCEFEGDDKLRLLPRCSHAFHLECIDTWLLSHSTCPLCRRSLLPDFSPNNSFRFSPIVLVLESASNESSREMMGAERAPTGGGDLGTQPTIDSSHKTAEVEVAPPEEKVVTVKLGKFRNADTGGEGTSVTSSNLDQRRCFSMGSYEYVTNESSLLRVSIKPSKRKPSSKKQRSRLVMSECDCHSRREGFDPSSSSAAKSDGGDAGIKTQKTESFSISKIWLRSKKDRTATVGDCSRRAFSFRHSMDDSKLSCGCSSPRSEYGVATRWEKSGSEVEFDVESGSCNNSIVGSLAEETPSFARRTLLWIVGRQNRVGDHVLS